MKADAAYHENRDLADQAKGDRWFCMLSQLHGAGKLRPDSLRYHGIEAEASDKIALPLASSAAFTAVVDALYRTCTQRAICT